MSEGVPSHETIVVPDHGYSGRDSLLQQCYDVRRSVFHYEQGFPLDTEIDEIDETATHFLLRLVPSLRPIGTTRVYRAKEGDFYKLGRLAVLRDFRQFRFGRELVLALHDWVVQDAKRSTDMAKREYAKVVIHSQIPVKLFYAKYGYEPEGDEFDEEGAEHQRMVARLSLGS